MVSSKAAPQTEGREDSLTLITLRASFLFPSLRVTSERMVARDFQDFIFLRVIRYLNGTTESLIVYRRCVFETQETAE